MQSPMFSEQRGLTYTHGQPTSGLRFLNDMDSTQCEYRRIRMQGCGGFMVPRYTCTNQTYVLVVIVRTIRTLDRGSFKYSTVNETKSFADSISTSQCSLSTLKAVSVWVFIPGKAS